jgi:HAD superfamily hydrolase (TIGR01509 family)
MHQPTAIVFDFDGVIIDTESPGYAVWRELFQEHGLELPLAKWVQCVGTNHQVFSPYDYFETALGRTIDREAIRHRTRRAWMRRVAAADLLPGVLGWLDDAQRLGVPVGVASSSSWQWVGGELRRRGMDKRFRVIRCSDHVRNVKPHPELYLAACEAMGVRPEMAIAVEDSPNGVAAAKAAGLFTLAVPGPITAGLDLSAADMRAASLADVPLADALGLLATRATSPSSPGQAGSQARREPPRT